MSSVNMVETGGVARAVVHCVAVEVLKMGS